MPRLAQPLRLSTRRSLTTSIHVVGKKNSVEAYINDGFSQYEKRLAPIMKINSVFHKSDEELVSALPSFKGVVIALDENGKTFTSREFSRYFYKALEEGGSQVTFVIGGFDGLPDQLKKSCQLMSLSKLTWTHQMARLLLIEQVYRATEIMKNSKYHKD